MLKCVFCDKEVPEYGGELLNADGDFACSKVCKDNYLNNQDLLLVAIMNDNTFDDFMRVYI